MYLNIKKILRYSFLMVIGLSMFFYGVIQWVIKDHSMQEPTDVEIIRRAKELGMIGIEERILIDLEEHE